MSHNLFISYSSKDREQTLTLVKSLRDSGYSCWIDQSELDAATRWSSEIVSALADCTAVLILLSPSSLASVNVTKELTAATELGKHILPVELERVQLTGDFLYHLSGVHRVGIENTDGIRRALEKMGVVKDSAFGVKHDSPDAQLLKPDTDLRLAVLPFEDLSPSHDNDWFADGMMDELINTLGSLSKLIVPGRSSVMVYKKDRPKASIIGQELEVRYIVEGAVRKAGEKIRISASLTDTKTNTQLWDDKFDGTFDDIFDFQERVATEITAGLKLRLTPQDKKKIEQKLTESPEAYEFFKKGDLYFNRQTKQDFLYALDCYTEAVKLDPTFAIAYAHISTLHSSIHRFYEHTDIHLVAASEAVEKARQLNADLPFVFHALSQLHLERGENEEAIRAAKKAIELEPKNQHTHFKLGSIYELLLQPKEAAVHFEEALRLDQTSLPTHSNLCLVYDRLKDIKKRDQATERALPYFERYIKKNPDDQNKKMNYAMLLEVLGRTEESLRIANELITAPNADGVTIYNGACIFARLQEHKKALAAVTKAVENGFINLNILRNDPDLDGLREMPEFKELLARIKTKD